MEKTKILINKNGLYQYNNDYGEVISRKIVIEKNIELDGYWPAIAVLKNTTTNEHEYEDICSHMIIKKQYHEGYNYYTKVILPKGIPIDGGFMCFDCLIEGLNIIKNKGEIEYGGRCYSKTCINNY